MATSAKEAATTLAAANFFELSLSDTTSTLSYEVRNAAGQPVLTYSDGKETKTFTGNDAVRRENTALGTLVTVILKSSIDSPRQLLTLVQPEVLVNGGPEKVSLPVVFHTTAGVIPHKPGPGQTYDVKIFDGTAVLKP